MATSGRPGPVVIDVPEDVSHATVEIENADLHGDPAAGFVPRWRSRPDLTGIELAAQLLTNARRPVILAGGGVHLSRAHDALGALSKTYGFPVAHTISGKGGVACSSPESVGLFGRYSRIANDLITRADCLLAVGTKLGEIATNRYSLIPTDVPVIQIEIDPNEIGRSTPVAVGLAGDARLALEDLYNALGQDVRISESLEVYHAEIHKRKHAWAARAHGQLQSDDVPIPIPRLVTELNRVMPPQSVLVADGGFASHWTGLLYDTKSPGRRFIANRGFASIGYGLPATIGASLGVSESTPVVGITGDGGLNMSLGELETAARVGRPIVMIVVNNAASGYVKALQHGMLGGRYQSADLLDLDYATIARNVGWEAHTVESSGVLRSTLERALLGSDRPALLDVKVTRDPARMLPGVDSRVGNSQPSEPAE